jgi:hypothetical protein
VVLPLSATVPILLLIAAEAALFDVHVSVALDPAVTVAGAAANVTVGCGGGFVLAAELPHPLNQTLAENKSKTDNNRREVAHQCLLIAADWVLKRHLQLPLPVYSPPTKVWACGPYVPKPSNPNAHRRIAAQFHRMLRC